MPTQVQPLMTFAPEPSRTVVSAENTAPLDSISTQFDLGYQNITDLYLHSDPYLPEELSAALSVVELHLDDVVRTLTEVRSPDDGRSAFDMTVRDATVVGVGPIFSTLAAVEIGDSTTDVDGFELTREAVEDVFRTIATESAADRAHNPGLGADWTPVIVGGCCLVVEAFRSWGLESIIVRAGS